MIARLLTKLKIRGGILTFGVDFNSSLSTTERYITYSTLVGHEFSQSFNFILVYLITEPHSWGKRNVILFLWERNDISFLEETSFLHKKDLRPQNINSNETLIASLAIN